MADVTKTIDIIVNTDKAVKSTKELNKELDTTQKETKETTEETKKYEKQLEDTSKVTGAFTSQLDKMTGGMFSTAKGVLSSVKALKSLKIALIATGLGAILVVIGAVATAFTRLEGPMRKVEEILGGLGGVMGVLGDRFAAFGLAVTDFLSGDMTGALENWKATWEGISEEMGKAFDLGVLLSRQIRENSVNESARTAIIAKNNRLIVESRRAAVDETLALKERLAAATEWERLNRENIELTRKNAEESLTIAKNEFELSPAGPTGKKRADAIIALNNAIADYNNKITSVQTQQIRLQTRKNQLLNVERREQQGITTEKEKQLTLSRTDLDLIEAEAEALDEIHEDFVKSTNEFEDAAAKRAEAIKDSNDVIAETAAEAQEDQTDLNTALGATANAAKGVLDIFQGKVDGKDIFKTVLKSLGGILNLILPGAGGIAGIVGGLFADGGIINGPSHKGGGTWINAEGGEAIINKRSMSIPWVHNLASDLNQIGGGVRFADGGIVPGQTAQEAEISQLSQSLQQQQIVLPIEDLNAVQNKVTVIEDRASI